MLAVRRNRSKLKKTKNFKQPKSKEALYSFLGLVNTLKNYSGALSEDSKELREVTSQKATWRWTEKLGKTLHLFLGAVDLAVF